MWQTAWSNSCRARSAISTGRCRCPTRWKVSASNLSTYWKALTAGQSGFGPPTIFAAERLSTKIVAEVKGFVPEDHFDSRQIGLLDRVSQFAVVAAREAITQSGLSFRDG